MDTSSSTRTRRPTDRFLQWQIEQHESRFKSAVTKWRRFAKVLSEMLSDCNVTVENLRKQREIVDIQRDSVTIEFDNLNRVLPQDEEGENNEKLLRVEHDHYELMTSVSEKICEIEAQNSDHGSRRSKHSSKRTSFSNLLSQSSAFSKTKLSAATEAAALRAKLQYLQLEHEKKFELERCQTRMNLSIAEAKLDAIVKIEKEDRDFVEFTEKLNLPSNDRSEYVQSYIESLQTVDECGEDTSNLKISEDQVNVSGRDQLPSTSIHKQVINQPISHQANRQVSPQVNQTVGQQVNPPVNHPIDLPKITESDSGQVFRLLAQQVSLGRLPTPEPSVFYGNALLYPEWKCAFEVLIERRGIPPNERIYYLKKYLAGPAKEAVEGFFLLNTPDAYEEAKKLIEERYGNSFVIASAFRDKLESWSRIQARDGKGLRKFADFLRQCETAMTSVDSLRILNDERENQKLIQKLPEWLGHSWRRVVADHRAKRKVFPPFSRFVKFVVHEANIACDPVTSAQPRMEQRFRDTTNTQGRSTRRTLAEKTSFSTDTKKVTDQKSVASIGKESEKANFDKTRVCILCNGDHYLDNCRAFLAKPLNERKQYAFVNNLCFGCLNEGHQARFCEQRLVCTRCSRQHATSFHGDFPGANRPDNSYQEQRTRVKGSQTAISMMSERTEDNEDGKCSMIVPVWLSAKGQDEERLVYALLDSQSDTTFILDKTCDALGLDGPEVQLNLSTMTDENRLVKSRRINDLEVRGHNGSVKIQLPVTYTRSIMPANLSHVPTPEKARQWEHLAEIADKLLPFSDIEVGLLIGYNCPKAIMPREVIAPVHDYEPYAERTDLGWGMVGIVKYAEDDQNDPIGTSHRIISREVPTQLATSHETPPAENIKSVHFSLATKIKENIVPKDVGKMFELDFNENAGDQKVSYDDRKFMDIMTTGIHKTGEHYEMPLPFKNKEPNLPNNRSLAAHRLRRLQSQFKNNGQYWKDYSAFMNNIIESGHAEKVPESELQVDNGHVWYIPHHGVYHPKKPGRIRVVFDCSSKFDGISLNDCLLKGPDLTNDLVGVLCRFRLETVAVMCDIEQMFHQFKVNPEHRNYLRFLWWNEGEQIVEYRMTVHLFGAASSPGCANFGLKQTAKDNRLEFGETAANFIQQNFYVDDGLSSLPTVDEAIKLIDDSKNMCEKGGLHLHKFVSNSKEVMAAIPTSEQSKVMKEIDIFSEPLPMERVLGVQWCIELDTFQFRITMKDSPLTRRGVLSTVSSIYDPLGFLAPFVLRGKLILQQLCKEDKDWDSPLPEHLQSQWDSWKREIILLQSINISRCIKPSNFGDIKRVELHHFSDGSTYAYGQCSYIRLVNSEDKIHCAFLMGKARVAPTKPTTIPRIELTAAVISVKVSTFLKNELRLGEFSEIFWTDSRIVLGYVNNDARRFHVFVANRIQQIRNRTEPEQWRYVATKLNPADEGSRGLHAKDLQSSKWLQGPAFLWKKDIHDLDKSSDCEIITLNDDPEVKKVKFTQSLATSAKQKPDSLLQRLEYFSDWFRLKRAVANCMKLTNHLKLVTKSVEKQVTPSLKVEDFHKAELVIIRKVQAESFSDEIGILQSLKRNEGNIEGKDERKKTSIRKKALKTTSALFRLDPHLDSDGLLRVGGRLKLSSMSEAVKHPVILPKRHHITQLIIRDCHEKTHHQGRGLTVNEIRSRGYWVIGCSSAVTNFISKCVLCRRLRGNTQNQKMADLPSDRTEQAPPFTYSAVDLFGPFYIKEGRKELKRYGVLFTCMACRAIHLETTNSLTTDSFICALRRFLALRGPVRQLRCDRGTNFVGALNEFEESKMQIDQSSVKDFLLKQNCDGIVFKMNPPMASHMGGVWERLIRSVRSVLASLLHQTSTQLDDESFRTLMSEVMSIVNSRPLTSDNLNDVTSLEALTPNHLVTMKSKVLLPPPGVFQKADMYSKKRWRRVQHLSDQFWCRWRKEYLQSLQIRQKWVRPSRDLREGDIVLLRDDNASRNDWKLARVTETVSSSDDHVRTVKLAVADRYLDNCGKRLSPVTFLERPIHKTVLLVENE